MGFDNPYDVDKAGKRVEFQKRLFESKRAWELAHDSFVTDRSYLDNLTYCALHMAEHLEEDAIEVFSQAMSRYVTVFVLSMSSFQSLLDGVRKTSTAYHQIYERLLDRLLTDLEGRQGFYCDVIYLGAPAERQRHAFSEIDYRLQNP